MSKFSKFILIFLSVCFLAILLYPYYNVKEELTVGIFSGSYFNVPLEDSNENLEYAIEKFHEKYPNAKVNYQSGIEVSDYDEWLAQAIVNDEMPDIFIVTSSEFENLASIKALRDITSFVEQLDMNVYYDSVLALTQIDGITYTLPYMSVPNMIFVNKSLLNNLGIELPKKDWTLDDLLDIAYRINTYNQENGTELYTIVGYDWLDAIYASNTYITSSNIDFVNDNSISAVEKMRELTKLSAITNNSDLFDKGQVAFSVMDYSAYRTYMPYPWRIKKFSNFEWDSITMPSFKNNKNSSQIDTLMIGMSSRTLKSDLAFEFMKCLAYDEDVQTNLVTNMEGVSVLKSVMQDDGVIAKLMEDNPGDSKFSMISINDVMNKGIAVANTKKYQQIINMMNSSVNDLLHNDLDIESSLMKLQNQMKEYINKY